MLLGLLLTAFMALGASKTVLRGATWRQAVVVGIVWFALYSVIVFFYWLLKARREDRRPEAEPPLGSPPPKAGAARDDWERRVGRAKRDY